jgi:hypothetical protein
MELMIYQNTKSRWRISSVGGMNKDNFFITKMKFSLSKGKLKTLFHFQDFLIKFISDVSWMLGVIVEHQSESQLTIMCVKSEFLCLIFCLDIFSLELLEGFDWNVCDQCVELVG